MEYLEALIAHIELWQPRINALGDTYFDEAMAQAKTSHGALCRIGREGPPSGGHAGGR